jgi:hypothetical protein
LATTVDPQGFQKMRSRGFSITLFHEPPALCRVSKVVVWIQHERLRNGGLRFSLPAEALMACRMLRILLQRLPQLAFGQIVSRLVHQSHGDAIWFRHRARSAWRFTGGVKSAPVMAVENIILSVALSFFCHLPAVFFELYSTRVAHFASRQSDLPRKGRNTRKGTIVRYLNSELL